MKTYSIQITDLITGRVSYLSFKGRTAWSRRQAQRHLKDAKGIFTLAKLEEN